MNEAIQILTLINALEPGVVALVKALMKSSQGKTVEEVLAESDLIWDAVIKAADIELAKKK